MTKKESKNKERKEVKTKQKFIPNELEDAIGITGEEKLEQEIFDFSDMCYTTFLLFYKYLKAAKIGRPFNGGWITNHFRIEQKGDIYTIVVGGIRYDITKESCTDITEFIKLYL